MAKTSTAKTALNIADYFGNRILDTMMDLGAIGVYYATNEFISYNRYHQIPSPTTGNPRSFIRLSDSTLPALKLRAEQERTNIRTNKILRGPSRKTSKKGFLRYYISNANVRLTTGRNARASDRDSLVAFLDDVINEIP